MNSKRSLSSAHLTLVSDYPMSFQSRADQQLGLALCCLISAGIYIARLDFSVEHIPFSRPKGATSHIEPDSAPHGPYWLNEDFGFYPVPTADGRNVSLLMSFKYRDEETWPLPPGQEVYCKGEMDETWSRMELREGLMEPPPHEHVNVFTCAASGPAMTFSEAHPENQR